MADTIILETDFGKFKAGLELEVVKAGKTTTIVNTASGKRIIVPNKHVKGASVPKKEVVILNGAQEMVKDALVLGEDSIEDIRVIYATKAGLSEKDALADIKCIEAHLAKGSAFKVEVKGSGSGGTKRPPVASELTETEGAVLKALLDGDEDAWKDPALGVPKEPEKPEEIPELGPNQIWFTDITNGRLPKSKINHVINQYAEDHFPEDIRVDIPEIDPSHHWDPEVLEALVLAHQLRERACITGFPGTGKTTSVKQFGAWIRQPYMRLGGRGDLESSSFLGYSWVDVEEVNGETLSKMSFKPGMLTQGLDTQGFGYLVTIDEVMKIPAYIQMCMQHLYEKDGHLTIDDKPGTKADKIITPAPEFLLILTDNVKGTGDSFDKFGATQIQDTSSLDRIGINETLGYLQVKDEVDMLLGKFPKADRNQVTKLVKFAGIVRNGYQQGNIALTLSPRGLMSILEMTENAGMPVGRAIDLAYANKIADEAEAITIKDALRTVGIQGGA